MSISVYGKTQKTGGQQMSSWYKWMYSTFISFQVATLFFKSSWPTNLIVCFVIYRHILLSTFLKTCILISHLTSPKQDLHLQHFRICWYVSEETHTYSFPVAALIDIVQMQSKWQHFLFMARIAFLHYVSYFSLLFSDCSVYVNIRSFPSCTFW